MATAVSCKMDGNIESLQLFKKLDKNNFAKRQAPTERSSVKSQIKELTSSPRSEVDPAKNLSRLGRGSQICPG